MGNFLQRKIFELVQTKKITPEVGFELIREVHANDSEKKGGHTINKEIAIIGISGRFPGANNIYEFWDNLNNGINCITPIPKEQIDSQHFLNKLAVSNTSRRLWMGKLKDVDKFDPLFFNISPKEAEMMDPQQRVFLEEAYRAIEDAGYSSEDLPNRCGVFVGLIQGDYSNIAKKSECNLDVQFITGSISSFLPARIAYYLNLTGPNMAIDTACSSSLVAIHQAIQSIKSGESDLAIAGGVSIFTTGEMYFAASQSGMLSVEGQCKVFDNDADGFVPGEGIGVVVLKALDKAIKDKDHIYGVIKGSGINQDGTTNGITAPSGNSQTKLEKEVYERYDINPEEITYVEAHGTGTKLGDPIEVTALTKAFRTFTNKKQFCAIGSVKSNIGHGLAAAGVSGLLKILLCFKQNKLVPSVNFKQENEHINFKDSPFYVVREGKEWRNIGKPRKAAISSFGLSGTNCHMVIEEPPSLLNKKRSDLPLYIFPISARTKEQLSIKINHLEKWLKVEDSYHPGDISFTLSAGRTHFPFRVVVLAKDNNDLLKKLKDVNVNGQMGQTYSFQYIKESTEKAKDEFNDEIENILNLSEPLLTKHLASLAEAFMRGEYIDWNNLFLKADFRRISLPGYPFERDRYWVADNEVQATQDLGKRLHPLIDSNESTLKMQCYKKVFSKNDFYLKDHIVFGEMVLPGVVYIEMARAAGALAIPKSIIHKIQNIIWVQPLTIPGDLKETYINLYTKGNLVEVEIGTYGKDVEKVILFQGSLMCGTSSEEQPFTGVIDIEAIRARCKKYQKGNECYESFKKKGLNYGKEFQPIKDLFIGESEALARLEVSSTLAETFNEYVLHPSLIDGALQTIMGIVELTGNTTEELQLPFALNEVELIGSITPNCYAHVVYAPEKSLSDGSMRSKYNITLSDEQGRIILKLKDLVLKGYKNQQTQADKLDKCNLMKLLNELHAGKLKAEEVGQLMGVI